MKNKVKNLLNKIKSKTIKTGTGILALGALSGGCETAGIYTYTPTRSYTPSTIIIQKPRVYRPSCYPYRYNAFQPRGFSFFFYQPETRNQTRQRIIKRHLNTPSYKSQPRPDHLMPHSHRRR